MVWWVEKARYFEDSISDLRKNICASAAAQVVSINSRRGRLAPALVPEQRISGTAREGRAVAGSSDEHYGQYADRGRAHEPFTMSETFSHFLNSGDLTSG